MVYVFFAEGFEELEALAPVDILRRGGIEVKTVGVGSKTVIGSHNIPVTCDLTESETEFSDSLKAVILPGGMPGTLNLQKSDIVNKFIDYANEKNLILAAICAAPLILGQKGLLKGKSATCFNGFEKDLIGADVKDAPVVRDGNIITSWGAGAAYEFAFELLSAISGDKEKSDNLRKSMRCI